MRLVNARNEAQRRGQRLGKRQPSSRRRRGPSHLRESPYGTRGEGDQKKRGREGKLCGVRVQRSQRQDDRERSWRGRALEMLVKRRGVAHRCTSTPPKADIRLVFDV
jgi:hypothetical protein